MTSLSCGLLLLGLSGCQTGRWDFIRKEQSEAFQDKLQKTTEAALPEDRTLTLDACISLSFQNNLEFEALRLKQKIAKLERQIAFANFLPQVDLSTNYVEWDRQPAQQMMGLLSVPMHDKHMLNTAIDVQMPIFVPSTWFLFMVRQRGVDISNLVVEYTRQQIAVQVTMLYFHCRALKESQGAIESRLSAAEQMKAETALYLKEGLVTPWQQEYVEARVLAQQNALNKNKRMQLEARSQLAAAMGLNPTAEFALAENVSLIAPEGAMEDLLLEALLAYPALQIADRKVAIQKNLARIALAEFLPKVVGLASYENTTNSLMKYASTTMTGIGGVMTIFDGLATIREYQIARQQHKAAYVEREQACLSVMLGVIKAHLNLENARADLVLAEKALQVTQGRLTEIEAQSAEGLVKPSDRMTALADRDEAQTNLTNARFMEQISIATLRQIVGAAYTGGEDNDDANQ